MQVSELTLGQFKRLNLSLRTGKGMQPLRVLGVEGSIFHIRGEIRPETDQQCSTSAERLAAADK